MRTPCNWTASGLSPNSVSASTSWLTSFAFFIASFPLTMEEPFTVTYKLACDAKISSRWVAETLIVSGFMSMIPLFGVKLRSLPIFASGTFRKAFLRLLYGFYQTLPRYRRRKHKVARSPSEYYQALENRG